MYRIMKRKTLTPGIVMMEVEAPFVAKKAMPGQFIMLRVKDEGERIPLTIADYDRDRGTISIIFQEVGHTTKELGTLNEGDSILDFAGPLGKASDLEGLNRVLCIGGGVGIAPLYPQIKYLSERGSKVDVIIGGRSAQYVILKEEIKKYANNLYIATDNGTLGHKGFVTEVAKEILDGGQEYDRAIAVGPLPMMKAVAALTKGYDIPTTVSMNPVMVDGTGMCGGCRVTVGGETYYACVDGPDFDGHKVDFDEALRRQGMYREEENHRCRLGQEGRVHE